MQSTYDLGSKIKEFRKEKRLTLMELAKRAGLSASLISQAERNRLSPSIAALGALANAMGTPMVKFFEEKQAEEIVMRSSGMGAAPWRVLLSQGMGAAVTAVVCNIPPNGKSRLRLEGRVDAEELGLVLCGQVKIAWGSELRALDAGDAIFFRRGRLRSAENTGKKTASILWIRSTH